MAAVISSPRFPRSRVPELMPLPLSAGADPVSRGPLVGASFYITLHNPLKPHGKNMPNCPAVDLWFQFL